MEELRSLEAYLKGGNRDSGSAFWLSKYEQIFYLLP